MAIKGYWRIIRPVNSVVAGLAAALGYLIATGTIIPSVILLVVIVILITGAGNTINDYFDLPIDRVNRPDRPLPSGAVTITGALLLAGILFIAGILISFYTNIYCAFFAIFNSLLLIVYSKSLKSTPFLGNLSVAYLAGSIFLFGGALAGIIGIVNNLVIALITIFAMLARELLKDAEDVPGDTEAGAKTLPVLYGVRLTAIISIIFTILAIVVSFYPYYRWGVWYLAGIIPVDCIILLSALRASGCRSPQCIKESHSTSYLKYGMFASLVVFTLAALFLK
jgi:geranylgeranylglycerol-phosphate geranylgeranyltransferase